MSGNFAIGSRTMGCASVSMRALQAWRTLPLMSMVHEPQTSSRQFASQTGAVVFLPSTVTGCRCTSIKAEITFMFALYGIRNSSQRLGAVGPSCLLTLRVIVCPLISIAPLPVFLASPCVDGPLGQDPL